MVFCFCSNHGMDLFIHWSHLFGSNHLFAFKTCFLIKFFPTLISQNNFAVLMLRVELFFLKVHPFQL